MAMTIEVRVFNSLKFLGLKCVLSTTCAECLGVKTIAPSKDGEFLEVHAVFHLICVSAVEDLFAKPSPNSEQNNKLDKVTYPFHGLLGST